MRISFCGITHGFHLNTLSVKNVASASSSFSKGEYTRISVSTFDVVPDIINSW